MSHNAMDAVWASSPHCRRSSTGTALLANASTARRRIGAARSRWSRTNAIRPSSKRSQGLTGSSAPVDHTARGAATRWPPACASGPASADATHTWRYVALASATSTARAVSPRRAAHWRLGPWARWPVDLSSDLSARASCSSSTASAWTCASRPSGGVVRAGLRVGVGSGRRALLRAAPDLRSGRPNARSDVTAAGTQRGLRPLAVRSSSAATSSSGPTAAIAGAMQGYRDRFHDLSLRRAPGGLHADRLATQRCTPRIVRVGGESAQTKRSRGVARRRPRSPRQVRRSASARRTKEKHPRSDTRQPAASTAVSRPEAR